MSDVNAKIIEISDLVKAYIKQEKQRNENILKLEDCICFTALQENSTISMKIEAGSNIEYSLDGTTWIQYIYDSSNPLVITLSKIGDVAFFKGNDSIVRRKEEYNGYGAFVTTGNLKVSGNIMSLIGAITENAVVPNNAFEKLFRKCTAITDVSELVLPSKKVGDSAYKEMFYNTGIKALPIMMTEQVNKNSYSDMFAECNSLEFVDVPVPLNTTGGNGGEGVLRSMFRGCTNLKYANLDVSKFIGFSLSQSWYFAPELFKGCTGLKVVKVNFDDFYSSRHFLENWLQNAAQDATLLCPPNLDTSTKGNSTVPAGWTVIKGGNDWNQKTTFKTDATETDSYMVCPSDVIPTITVSTSLTLDAINLVSAREIAYAEIVLDVAANATVTAGTNLEFVDEPADDQRNICVVRWQDGVAKLYVTMTEDLNESSSSN